MEAGTREEPGGATFARRAAACLALFFALVSTPSAAFDGGSVDAGLPVEGELAADASARVRELTVMAEALEALVAGRLDPRLPSAQLFQIDLRDEAAVVRRRAELQRLLAQADGGSLSPVEQAEQRVLAARLAFLEQPAAARQAILALEAATVSSAQAREAALEQQARASDDRRAAELAQQAALAVASEAANPDRRVIASELARLQAVRAEQDAFKEANAARRETFHARQQQAAAARLALGRRADAAAPGSAAEDLVFGDVQRELAGARSAFRQALDALRAPVDRAPRAALAVTLGDAVELRPAREELVALADALNRGADEIEEEQRRLAFDEAEAAAEHLGALNDLRLRLLGQLSAPRATEIRGLGPDGREALRGELEHLELMASWRRVAEGPILRRWLGQLAEPVLLAEAILRGVALLVLLALARFLVRRAGSWLRLLRAVIVRRTKAQLVARSALVIIDMLSAVASEAIALAAVLIAGELIAPALQRPVVGVLWTFVVDFAVYRLAIRAFHGVIGWLAWSPLGALSEQRSARAFASVRLVGLYAFVVHVVLVLSETVLGRGLLYDIVLRVSWLGGAPIAVLLMRWWKQDITDAYLRVSPDGLLARAVKSSRERSYAFVVALLAFVVVFFRWLGAAARRFVMRFDQTRKALAYVFRRRLERRADEKGEGADEASAQGLPPELRALFAPEPVAGEPFKLERFPRLDELEAELNTWREREEHLGAWLVVGRTGLGKTSWLNAAVARAGTLPIVRIELAARLATEAELVRTLAGAAKVQAASLDELVAALDAGPRRMIVIDDLQNLVLRAPGRLAPWDALTQLMQRTGARIFWLGAFAYQPFHFLEWARHGAGAFRTVVRLRPWSEAGIHQLLEARTARSGWTVSYDDLLVAGPSAAFEAGEVVQTAQEFTRLIWDYADGSPRVALDCWAKSLVPDGPGRLKVRLFPRPDEAVLEDLDEVGRFTLGAVVWHENIEAREAALALQLPEAACRDALERLFEHGVLERRGGRSRVTVWWWPVVTRYLVRKHLVLS